MKKGRVEVAKVPAVIVCRLAGWEVGDRESVKLIRL